MVAKTTLDRRPVDLSEGGVEMTRIRLYHLLLLALLVVVGLLVAGCGDGGGY
jgi:hypothetical protein